MMDDMCCRVVNVMLTHHTSISGFAAYLEAVPKAHTLRVLMNDYAPDQMTAALKTAFGGRSFPSIRTVILPSHAYYILKCCKEARIVVSDFGDSDNLISTIMKDCRQVESLEGIKPTVNVLECA